MASTPDFADRAALLDAVDHHPYAQLTAGGDVVSGYRGDNALVWTARGPWGPAAASLGDGAGASRIFLALAHRTDHPQLGRARLNRLAGCAKRGRPGSGYPPDPALTRQPLDSARAA
jgi:hypothetical protein